MEVDGKYSSETFKLCATCKEKRKNQEAKKYCLNCQDYYCSTCVQFHDSIPALRNHTILETKDIKSGQESLNAVITDKCKRHGFKAVDMYCKDHDLVGCHTCMTVDHRVCSDVFYIPEFIQNNSEQLDITTTRKELKQKIAEMKSVLEHHTHEKEELLKRKTQKIDKIMKFREEINKRLDELEHISINEVEFVFDEIIHGIDCRARVLGEYFDSLQKSLSEFKIGDSNPAQQFVTYKKTQRLIKRTLKPSSPPKMFNVGIIINAELQSLLKMVTGFVKIQHPYNVHEKRLVNIQTQDDFGGCHITSVCSLDAEMVLLADNSNDKIKRLNTKMNIITDHIEMHWPWQICHIDRNEVAVSSTFNRSVVILICNKEDIVKTRTIEFDHECYGICYISRCFYVSDFDKTVFIHNMHGEQLNTFTNDQSGQRLFVNIYSIDRDGSNIFVANGDRGIIKLNENGKVCWRYNESDLKCCTSVCLADFGSAFVCGSDSNNILQLTEDGEVLGEVVSPVCDVANCRSVCYNSNARQMIVSRIGSSEIEIYQLVSK